MASRLQRRVNTRTIARLEGTVSQQEGHRTATPEPGAGGFRRPRLALSPVNSNKFRPFLRPEGYILAAAVLLAAWNRLEQQAADIINLAPPAAALAGLIVAWRLRRSRLVFSLTVLGLAYLLVSRWAPADADALQLAAILVPLNLAAIALFPERGVFTAAGLWHWGDLEQ